MTDFIQVGMPSKLVALDDETGALTPSVWQVDGFDGAQQPARLDSWSRFGFVATLDEIEAADGDRLFEWVHYSALVSSAVAAKHATNPRLVPVDWAMELCDPNANGHQGEIWNWKCVFNFTNPNRFGANVPDGVKGSTHTEPGANPEDPPVEVNTKWYQWSSIGPGNHDIGYWLPDPASPTDAIELAIPGWFFDKVPTTGRESRLVDLDAGISVISVQDWNKTQRDNDWKVVTEEDLIRWGVQPANMR